MILQSILFMFFMCLTGYFQVKSISKKKQRRDLIVYLVLMGIASVAVLVIIMQIDISSPNRILEKVFNPISNYILGL